MLFSAATEALLCLLSPNFSPPLALRLGGIFSSAASRRGFFRYD